MKNLKLTIAFSFLFISFFNFSQSNTLVVFSQDPTPFYIVLDGVKKNEVAETRVVVPGIRQTNSNVQIFFKDESIAPISKNIWWDEEHKNDEVTFRIVPVKKGYKLRFFSTVPNKVNSTPPPSTPVAVAPQTSQNIQSTTTTVVTENTTLNNTGKANSGNVNMNSNMNTGMDANNGNISMSINVNDGINMATGNENINMSMNINVNEGNMDASNAMNGNMNVNMNMSDASMNTAMNQTNSNMAVNMNVNEIITSNNNTSNTTNMAVNETVTTTTTTIYEAPAAASAVPLGGCVSPVQDMGSIMDAIDDESFDEGKMIVAKQATSKKCLTVDQIKQIMEEFSFSKNKLDFAKYGYKRCYNPDDYYQVNAAFDFSSDKEKLNEYINGLN